MQFNSQDLLAMAPQLILAGGALLVLILQMVLPGTQRVRVTDGVALFTLLCALAVVLLGLSDASGSKTVLPAAFGSGEAVTAFNASYRYSVFSANVLAVLLLLVMGAILVSRAVLPQHGIHFVENAFFLLLSACGYGYALCAEDLITLFVALELGTLPLLVLLGMERRSRAANEAALKYLLLSAFAVGFFLLGIALLYGSHATMKLRDLREAGPHYLRMRAALLGYIFVIAGFLFKLGAVPLHSYVADVYEGTTTVFAAILASFSKFASVMVFFRVAQAIHDGYRQYLAPVLTALAVASLFYGAFAAMGTRNLKRILAYSSISHAGFMLCFFAIPGSAELGLIGSIRQDSGAGLFLYAASYAISAFLAFTAVALLELHNGRAEIVTLENIAQGRKSLAAVALALAVLSLAGFPPLAGFLGKFFLFKSLAFSGHLPLGAAAGLATAVGIWGYARILKAMFFSEQATLMGFVPGRGVRIVLVTGLLFLAFLGFATGFLYNNNTYAVQRIY